MNVEKVYTFNYEKILSSSYHSTDIEEIDNIDAHKLIELQTTVTMQG